jgi:hypothetical protein
MFRWYHDAVKCYVYLVDGTTAGQDLTAQIWALDFRKSRWFTRGWALQELIAPSKVGFAGRRLWRASVSLALSQIRNSIVKLPSETMCAMKFDAVAVVRNVSL